MCIFNCSIHQIKLDLFDFLSWVYLSLLVLWIFVTLSYDGLHHVLHDRIITILFGLFAVELIGGVFVWWLVLDGLCFAPIVPVLFPELYVEAVLFVFTLVNCFTHLLYNLFNFAPITPPHQVTILYPLIQFQLYNTTHCHIVYIYILQKYSKYHQSVLHWR